jgi:raffinose/stachyose/melibiose transport system permease protein
MEALCSKKRKTGRSGADRRRMVGTALTLPAFLTHALIVSIPSLTMFYYALTDWNGLGHPNFVGLSNFASMFHDVDFGMAVVNNLKWMAWFLVVPLVIGLGLALLFTKMGKMQMIYRTLCFLPYVVSSVVAGEVFSSFYSPFVGVSSLFEAWKFAPLGSTKLALLAVAFVDNWHWWGFVLVLMISALHQVDLDLYDAAAIDGTNTFQKFFYITLPQIKNSILSYLVFNIVACWKTFDYVWIMTQGGPAGSTELVATWIYKKTFISYDVGYGCALSLTICLTILILYVLQEVVRKILQKRHMRELGYSK